MSDLGPETQQKSSLAELAGLWKEIRMRETMVNAEKVAARQRMIELLEDNRGKTFIVSGYISKIGQRFVSSDGKSESWTYASVGSLLDDKKPKPMDPVEMEIKGVTDVFGGKAVELQYPGSENRVWVINLDGLVSIEDIPETVYTSP